MMVHSAEIFSFFSNNPAQRCFFSPNALHFPVGVNLDAAFPRRFQDRMGRERLSTEASSGRSTAASSSGLSGGLEFARVFCADCFGLQSPSVIESDVSAQLARCVS